MNETNLNESADSALTATNSSTGVVETKPVAGAVPGSGEGTGQDIPWGMVIWAVILVVMLVVAKKRGWLDKLRTFFLQTREELRKCTWPNKEEMRGQTIMVLVAVVLLGGFTFAADYVLGGLVIQDLLLTGLGR